MSTADTFTLEAGIAWGATVQVPHADAYGKG